MNRKKEMFYLSFFLSILFTAFYMYNWFSAFFCGGQILFTVNEYGEAWPELIIMVTVIVVDIIGVWSLYGLTKLSNNSNVG